MQIVQTIFRLLEEKLERQLLVPIIEQIQWKRHRNALELLRIKIHAEMFVLLQQNEVIVRILHITNIQALILYMEIMYKVRI